MGCIAKLLPLSALKPAQLAAQVEEALPVLTSGLDDDNVETRRLGCCVFDALMEKLGKGGLDQDRTRKLYPELLKRLDDASDEVRVQACAPLTRFARTVDYSSEWREDATLDKANFQYLVRGLLVHLDDPNPEIQQAVYGVLEAALEIDPPIFATEVVAVRERHRSPKLCDALTQHARSHGQVV